MKWVQLLTPIYTKAQSGLAQAVSVSLGPSSLHDPLGLPVGTTFAAVGSSQRAVRSPVSSLNHGDTMLMPPQGLVHSHSR